MKCFTFLSLIHTYNMGLLVFRQVQKSVLDVLKACIYVIKHTDDIYARRTSLLALLCRGLSPGVRLWYKHNIKYLTYTITHVRKEKRAEKITFCFSLLVGETANFFSDEIILETQYIHLSFALLSFETEILFVKHLAEPFLGARLEANPKVQGRQ